MTLSGRPCLPGFSVTICDPRSRGPALTPTICREVIRPSSTSDREKSCRSKRGGTYGDADKASVWSARLCRPRRWLQDWLVNIARRKSSFRPRQPDNRSEEHTSELQSLMRISYAVVVFTKNHYQH